VTGTLLLVNSSGQVSGAEVVLLALVDEARRRGHPVVVACPPGPLVQRLPDGCRHLPLPTLNLGGGPLPLAAARYALRSLSAGRRIRAQARRSTATVVNSLLALPAARVGRPSRSVSWLVHDVVHRRDQELLVRVAGRVVRRAVAVSRATAAPLARLGLPVVVAPNGVQQHESAVPLDVHRPPVVGALALLVAWKGHRVLLEAVARLPDVHLELAGGHFPGDEPYVAELRERAERPDLRGRVTFLGQVDRDETLRRWDVMVSASTSPEAMPLSVLEALSAGVPVVGTAHGGTVELLEGGAGLLVPPGDADALAAAIARAVGEPELRRRMAADGRQVAREHDLAGTIPVMLDALLSADS
jgi:glycosyltransferase involved in cell wall biosynthesis